MINWISTWAEQIIVAVIIVTIIEMILPNGNNKKYVKTVLGIYILFTILSPIISKFGGIDIKEFDYKEYFKSQDTYEAMSEKLVKENDKTVEDIYISNIKQDIKVKLEKKDYGINSIIVKLNLENKKKNENYGKLNGLIISAYLNKKDLEEENQINKINNISVNKIIIGNSVNSNLSNSTVEKNEDLDSKQINEIKAFLSDEYNIKKENIEVNNK